MVVKFESRLFYKKKVMYMLLYATLIELKMSLKWSNNGGKNAIIKFEKRSDSMVDSLANLQIEYKATQGIGNNDVINRTKLGKLRNLRSIYRSFTSPIDRCMGFVCGKMDINSEKLRFNP